METTEFILNADQLDGQEINPTELDIDIYEGLKRSIKKDGIKQRVLVHPLKEGRYKIIDGHHRVSAAQDVGIQNIPVICLEGATEEDIMLLVILMNRAKGEFKVNKLVLVLRELQKTYTKEQIEDMLAYTEIDIDNFNALADLSELDEIKIPEKPPKEIGEDKIPEILPEGALLEMNFLLTRDQLRYIENVLYTVNTDKDKNTNLATVCTMYLDSLK